MKKRTAIGRRVSAITIVLLASSGAGTHKATAAAHSRVDGRSTSPGAAQATLARVGLSSGWATFGEALPPGQAFDGLQVGALETQNDGKKRWADGSIKFAIVTANAPAAGTYDVIPAPLPAGSFAPVVPGASVTLTIGGTAYTAALPTSPGSDAWIAGPLAFEWRR